MSTELTLTLFIAGEPEHAEQLRERVTALLDKLLERPYQLRVIDVLEEPHLADLAHILITPTLLIQFDGSEQRLVGDLSNLTRLQLVIQDPAVRGD